MKAYAAMLATETNHGDGFNFGGQHRAWSNKILATLLQEELSRETKVAVIDYQTCAFEIELNLVGRVLLLPDQGQYLHRWQV